MGTGAEERRGEDLAVGIIDGSAKELFPVVLQALDRGGDVGIEVAERLAVERWRDEKRETHQSGNRISGK